jgi:dihydrofolate reductase
MRKSIIAACDRAFLIGSDGRLPWHLPEDLRLFRQLTVGKPVIMGRITFESIGKPLPGRTNIVLSRSRSLVLPGCRIAHSLEEAFRISEATGADECMVIGGADVYEQAVWVVDRIYLTLIDHKFSVANYRARYFPRNGWHEARKKSVVSVLHPKKPGNRYAWAFHTIDLGGPVKDSALVCRDTHPPSCLPVSVVV